MIQKNKKGNLIIQYNLKGKNLRQYVERFSRFYFIYVQKNKKINLMQ